jgi:hypothetical protein
MMNLIRKNKFVINFFLASSLLFLTACGASSITVDSMNVNKPALHLPAPDPIVLQDYTFVPLINSQKPGQYGSVADAFKNTNSSILFALTPEQLSTLRINQAKIYGYLQQEQSILKAYKDYYEPQQPTNKNTKGP